MIKITNDMDLVNSTENAVAYFTASWCSPCKQLKPIYAKSGMEDNNHTYFVIDVDSISPDYLQKYNIQSVPKIFKIKNGTIEKEIISRTSEEIFKEVNL